MARALGEDIRSRVLKASDDGMSARKAASRFGIGVSSAIRWIARAKLRETTPRPQGRRRGSSLDAHEVFIVGMIEERKDITLNEMVERLAAERAPDVPFSPPTINRITDRFSLGASRRSIVGRRRRKTRRSSAVSPISLSPSRR